ncbi:MAG: HTH-type transcriptional activator IlvY [Proteobacteria bacterium]|nr:HTH-type transcriptional activator IlvY [Pseudomonadota bacterium]MBU4471728.1 HTH-type transcriptional activator IlvY [Pseudomonadota bacterium]MCG2750509.1 HTH-type transcriptional activator IlvY [Desulfobacteraceae bacterium]
MNIHEIETFLTLCRTLHFQKASTQCNLSPSALSRAIQRLEDETGEQLFERSNRAVRLTASGRVFQEYAQQIIDLWKQGKQALSYEKGLVSGDLNIYCSVTAAFGILPDILDHFKKEFPAVQIKIRTGDAESALGQLQEKDTDIAIAAIPEVFPDHMDYLYVTQTPLVWIKSDKIPAMAGDPIDWENTPLILPKRGIARRCFERWAQTMAIKPRIYAEISGNEAIIAMVHLGCGIGLVPEMVLDKSPVTSSISVINVQPPLKPYTIGICVKKKQLEKPVTRAFWSVAKRFS